MTFLWTVNNMSEASRRRVERHLLHLPPGGIMDFEPGTKVKIVARTSTHKGDTGTVLSPEHERVVNHTQQSWREFWPVFVMMDAPMDNAVLGFQTHELEAINND